MDPVIVLEKIGKVYHRNEKNALFFNFFNRIPKNRTPIQALKDVSFYLNKGEILGVIGGNGAGKSTLLKILSQITSPSTGTVKMTGTVCSLLEIGTGFHPDLSGIDNIYTNGALLGMTKKQINQKLREIVDFSGLEDFINQPVRHYSSGMVVRLAFSIATHLDSDILLLDEIFAVGDEEFKKKSITKIEDLFRKNKTILYVSHDLESVKKLCTKCLLLEKGQVVAMGDVLPVIDKYLNYHDRLLPLIKEFNGNEKSNHIKYVRFVSNQEQAIFKSEEEIVIEFCFVLLEEDENIDISMSLFSNHQKVFMVFGSDLMGRPFRKGENKIRLKILSGFLNKGLFYWNLVLHKRNIIFLDIVKESIYFQIKGNHSRFDKYPINSPGIVNMI